MISSPSNGPSTNSSLHKSKFLNRSRPSSCCEFSMGVVRCIGRWNRSSLRSGSLYSIMRVLVSPPDASRTPDDSMLIRNDPKSLSSPCRSNSCKSNVVLSGVFPLQRMDRGVVEGGPLGPRVWGHDSVSEHRSISTRSRTDKPRVGDGEQMRQTGPRSGMEEGADAKEAG